MASESVVQHRYRLGELLGQGAMGAVFRGVDELTGHAVAIKLLKAATFGEQSDAIERFRREGETLARLNHPGIVKILDVFQDDGRHYLVMELVEGGSLEAVARRAGGRLPIGQVLAVGLDLADALSRAHHVGIVHRDLKPANVLIAQDGSARLTDFGVALDAGKERLSSSSAVVGTLDYLSPEAIRSQTIDARADLWALGVVLFELLAGSPPFAGAHVGATLNAILQAPTPDLEALRPDCPIEFVDLVYRMLEKQRDQRIPSAREAGAELERIQRQARLGVEDTTQHAAGEPAGQRMRAGATERFGEAALAVTAPRPAAARQTPSLPAPSTPFFGREHELAELARLLRDPAVRLVTVLGPGGMGKTRFALEAARRFVQGSAEFAETLPERRAEPEVVLVELAPLAGPELVLPAIAEALAFKFHPGSDPNAQLLGYLRYRHTLLLLDNFEHVLAAGGLVNEILGAASGVRVLVTSRERLAQSGEHVLAMAGMAYPEAAASVRLQDYCGIKLLFDCARRVNPSLEQNESNELDAARICRAVQGLPLGIVLAASWSNVLDLREIADEVSRGFEFLSAELQDIPTRQHSLRAVFDYSYRLLGEDQRRLFSRLAVFRGGFERVAAERVAGANLKALATLVNKSLITRDPRSGRYHVHELLRQYAESKGEQSPREHEQVRARHARHFTSLLAEIAPAFKTATPEVATMAVERELDNGRAAWAHSLLSRDAVGIANALEPLASFYWLRSAFNEADSAFGAAAACLAVPMPERCSSEARLLAQALALKGRAALNSWRNVEAIDFATRALALIDEASDPLLAGEAWLVQAVSMLWDGSIGPGLEAVEHADSLFRRAGNEWELAQALLRLGHCRDWLGRARCEVLIREAIEIQRSFPGGPAVSGESLHDLGDVIAERGSYVEGCRLMREGLALLERHGSLFERHMCLLHLASAERKSGDYVAAEEHARASLALARDAFPFAETWPLVVLADVLKDSGRFDEATHCFRSCLAGGEALPGAVALLNLGDLALQRGQPDGEAMLNQGLTEFERHGARWGIAIGCDYLGSLACARGDLPTALSYFRRGLREALAEDLVPLAMNHLVGIARTKAREDELERAVELLGVLDHNPICERVTLETHVLPLLAELSSRMPAAAFASAKARGRTLDLDQTLRELSVGG